MSRAGRPLGFCLLALLAVGLLQDSLAQSPADRSAPAQQATRQAAQRLLDSAQAAYRRGDCDNVRLALLLYQQAAARLGKQEGRLTKSIRLYNMAKGYHQLGLADSALLCLREALALGQALQHRERQFETLNFCAEIFQGLGRLDSAGFYYRRALALQRAASEPASPPVVFINLGAALHALGNPGVALSYLQRALASLPPQEHGLAGVACNNLGRVLQTLGRSDSALVYFRAALGHRRAAGDRFGEAVTLNNMGYSFDLLQQLDSAQVYYRRANAAWQQQCRPSDQGMTLINLGRIWLAQGQPDSALAYLSRGLHLKEAAGDRSGEAWALNDMGRVYQQRGDHELAREYYHRALARLREVGDRSRAGVTWYNLGRLFHEAGPQQNLERAIACYDSAAQARAAVRRLAGADDNRLSFAEQDIHLFEHWALACLALAKSWGRENAHAAALAAAQRGRAQSLLDLLPGASIQPAGSANLIAEGKQYVQQMQQAGAGLLSYLVTADTLVVWFVLPSGESHLQRVAVSHDSLAQLVNAMRWQLGAEAGGRVVPALERGLRPAATGPSEANAAGKLAKLLLPPAPLLARLPEASELVIIPHGSLGFLPFAALPVDSLGNCLGMQQALRYVPSLAMLAALEKKQSLRDPASRPARFASALIAANPKMPQLPTANGESLRLAPLPGAEQEGWWLAHKLKAHALLGAQATESAVREKLPAAALVHFATHGCAFASEAQVRESFLALAPDKDNEGLLTVGEIMNEKSELTAELIVLSACQTGLGNLKQAEGVVGLQRAFLAKGAASVLVSLWNVSDTATQILMKAFYTHWLDDPDRPGKARALQRAQQDVRQAGFDHARYWAAFQLVGAP